jgi:hypothetical protein
MRAKRTMQESCTRSLRRIYKALEAGSGPDIYQDESRLQTKGIQEEAKSNQSHIGLCWRFLKRIGKSEQAR